jgi:hypothetical protein
MAQPFSSLLKSGCSLKEFVERVVCTEITVALESETERAAVINVRTRRKRNGCLHLCILANANNDELATRGVRTLLEMGANPNATNRDGESPLWLTFVNGLPRCAEQLLRVSEGTALLSWKKQSGLKSFVRASSAEVTRIMCERMQGDRSALGELALGLLANRLSWSDKGADREMFQSLLEMDDVHTSFAKAANRQLSKMSTWTIATAISKIRPPPLFTRVLEAFRDSSRLAVRVLHRVCQPERAFVLSSEAETIIKTSMIEEVVRIFGKEVMSVPVPDSWENTILFACPSEAMVRTLVRLGADVRAPSNWLKVEGGLRRVELLAQLAGIELSPLIEDTLRRLFEGVGVSNLVEFANALAATQKLRLNPESEGGAPFYEDMKRFLATVHTRGGGGKFWRDVAHVWKASGKGAHMPQLVAETYRLLRDATGVADNLCASYFVEANALVPGTVDVMTIVRVLRARGDYGDDKFLIGKLFEMGLDGVFEGLRGLVETIDSGMLALLCPRTIRAVLETCRDHGARTETEHVLGMLSENKAAGGELMERVVASHLQIQSRHLEALLREKGDQVDWLFNLARPGALVVHLLIDDWRNMPIARFRSCVDALPRRGNFPARGEKDVDPTMTNTLLQELWARRASATSEREELRFVEECCVLVKASEIPLCRPERLHTFIDRDGSWWLLLSEKFKPTEVCGFLRDHLENSTTRQGMFRPATHRRQMGLCWGPVLEVPNFFCENPTFPLIRTREELWVALRSCFPDLSRRDALNRLFTEQHVRPARWASDDVRRAFFEVVGTILLLSNLPGAIFGGETYVRELGAYALVRHMWLRSRGESDDAEGAEAFLQGNLKNWMVWKRILEAWLGIPREFLQESFWSLTGWERSIV